MYRLTRIFVIFTVLTTGFLAANSILYPTFSYKYLGLSSLAVFTIYSVLSLGLVIFKTSFLPKWLIRINQYFAFPLLITSSAAFIFLEKTNYLNYVLEHFHIFPYSYIYLFLLSGLILFISYFRCANKTEKIVWLLFPIIFITFYYLWIEQHFVFLGLISDDSIVEYLQFFFYLLAAGGFFRIFLTLKRRRQKWTAIAFLLLSLGLFFVSGEEISWGQRIFGFETPDNIEKVNIQREANIHNLFSYDLNQKAYLLVGTYGVLSRIIVKKLLTKKLRESLLIFTPPFSLVPYFLFLFLIYYDRTFTNIYHDTAVNDVFRKYTGSQWLEISELYLSVAFWFYYLFTYKLVGSKV